LDETLLCIETIAATASSVIVRIKMKWYLLLSTELWAKCSSFLTSTRHAAECLAFHRSTAVALGEMMSRQELVRSLHSLDMAAKDDSCSED
jgi:hypothetical protein